jgi:hypothetical protein
MKIKECPFCGSKAKLKLAGFYKYVECTVCRARGSDFNTDTSDYTYDSTEESIKAWNKRI